MAGITNLTIEKGVTFDVTITLNDASGNPIDLTEYTASGKMRSSLYNTSDVFNIDCNIVSPATNGNIQLYQDYDYTATIPPGRYFYTVDIFDSGNDIKKRVLEGLIIVTPSASIYEGATGIVGATGIYDGLNFYLTGATSFLRLH